MALAIIMPAVFGLFYMLHIEALFEQGYTALFYALCAAIAAVWSFLGLVMILVGREHYPVES